MRFAAYMIDVIIVLLAFEVIHVFMIPVFKLLKDTPLGGKLFFEYTFQDIIEYILATTYFVVMTYFTGATLGKKLLKLKVISVKGDGKLKFFDVLYRETIGRYLSEAFYGILYIAIAFNDEKKAIHDMLCDTRVVEVKTKRAVPVRTVAVPPAAPVVTPDATSGASPNVTVDETSKVAQDMVPQMVEEPALQGSSYIEERVQEQWSQILKGDS